MSLTKIYLKEDLPTGARSLAKQCEARGLNWAATRTSFEGTFFHELKMWQDELTLRMVASYKDGKFTGGWAWASWLELRKIGARDIANVLKGTLDPRAENPVPECFRDVCAAYAVEKYDGDNY